MGSPYKRIFVGGRSIDEHRHVMEEYIGRKLKRSEVVHHINGNKKDNGIENLKIMTQKEHNHLHNQVYPETKTCVICNEIFTPHKTKRKRNITCSNDCKIKLDKIHAAQRKRKIDQFTKTGLFIKTWDSARDIQNALNIYESNINKCCNNVINTAYGYKWKYNQNTY